jgi:hypothetical protein
MEKEERMARWSQSSLLIDLIWPVTVSPVDAYVSMATSTNPAAKKIPTITISDRAGNK